MSKYVARSSLAIYLHMRFVADGLLYLVKSSPREILLTS